MNNFYDAMRYVTFVPTVAKRPSFSGVFAVAGGPAVPCVFAVN
jgi:hypothetical protein